MAELSIDRVAASLLEQIRNGTFEAGTQLPSYATLAGRYGVSMSTINRAVDKVRATGLLAGDRGRPPVVVEGLKAAPYYGPPRAVLLVPRGEGLEATRSTESMLAMIAEQGMVLTALVEPDKGREALRMVAQGHADVLVALNAAQLPWLRLAAGARGRPQPVDRAEAPEVPPRGGSPLRPVRPVRRRRMRGAEPEPGQQTPRRRPQFVERDGTT